MRALIGAVIVVISLPVMINAQQLSTSDQSYETRLDAGGIRALYKGLTSLQRSEQRQVMHVLDPVTRAALWRYNLDVFVRNHAGLSSEQMEMIRAARALFTADLFDTTNPEWSSRQANLTALHQWGDLVFPLDLQYEAFFTLGLKPPARSNLPARETLNKSDFAMLWKT